MDQGANDGSESYEAFEESMDQKAIKVLMDRAQAMDQGVKDGSRIN